MMETETESNKRKRCLEEEEMENGCNGSEMDIENLKNGFKSAEEREMDDNVQNDEDDYRNQPLLHDVVVEKILEYTQPKYLYACRLVCKKWEGEAWKQIQRRNNISITRLALASISNGFFNEELRLNKLEFKDVCATQNAEALQTLFGLTGVHVKELSLEVRDGQLSQKQLFNAFLRKTPNLERLTLKCLSCNLFRQEELSPTEVLEIPPKLLKLKTLVLGERCHYSPNAPEESKAFSVKLLSTMPNIETLTGKVGWCASSLIKALDTVHLSRLAHLSLQGAFTRESAEVLEKLNLKTLYLGVGTHYNEDSRHNVIYSQRGTIQTLGVGWSSFQSRVSNNQLLADFPHLKYLCLCDFSKWYFNPCPKKHLVARTGIQKLQIDIRNPFDVTFVELNPCFQHVKELDIGLSGPSSKEEENSPAFEHGIEILKSTFPQVTSLIVRAPLIFPFGLIFKHFSDVEKLAIIITVTPGFNWNNNKNYSYFDHVLVGMERSICDRFRPQGPIYLEHDDVSIKAKIQEAQTHLSNAQVQASWNMPISNLQKLKKLVVMTNGLVISTVTVQLCLWIMPKLTSITLDPADENVESCLREVCSPAVYLHIAPPTTAGNPRFKLLDPL